MDTYAYDHNLPCHNSNCRSFGKPHPNCKCYSGGGAEGAYTHAYAHGGSVCAGKIPHLPGCEFYKAGGPVEAPVTTNGHAAVNQGLLGLLTNTGKAKLQEPVKHEKIFQDAKDHFERMQDQQLNASYRAPRSPGVKLAEHLGSGDFDKAADLLQGHPAIGQVGQKDLSHVLGSIGNSLLSKMPYPEAAKGTVQFLSGALAGKTKLKKEAEDLFNRSGPKMEADKDSRLNLKEHLKEIEINPEKLLDVGGNLGHYAPDHATEISAMAMTATQYLNSLKPKPQQMGSLDAVIPPDKVKESAYDRQLDLSQKPTLIFQHVKDGTLLPQDLTTVKTIFPGLYKSLINDVSESVVEAKTKNTYIPYKQKLSLSLLLGEPLDGTMTTQARQAIIKSQSPQMLANQEAKKQEGAKKATDVELKQINKVDAIAETPIQSRQIDRKN